MGYWIRVQAAVETAKISIPTIVQAMLNRTDMDACNKRLASWSARLVEQAGIRLETVGREHIDASQCYVVMSNHESHYDIPVVFEATGIPLRMVAKKELFSIPVMGRAMRDSGFVELDRKHRTRAIAQLAGARERLSALRLSVWIAPEGTRSTSGELGAFKAGGFHMAKAAGLPILPVTLEGTGDVHRPGDTKVHRGRLVRVVIHPPIAAAEVQSKAVKVLMTETKATIASALTARNCE